MSTVDGRKRRAVSNYGVETGHGAPDGMKAQSELAGDCKSHAEMTWPVTVTECETGLENLEVS